MTQTPVDLTQRLNWVDIETRPYSFRYTGGDYETGPTDEQIEVDPAIAAALSPAMLVALNQILDNPDGATCAGNGCKAAVGEVLWEDDEGRGGLSWHWTALVEVDGRVLAVCEECSPTNLYDATT